MAPVDLVAVGVCVVGTRRHYTRPKIALPRATSAGLPKGAGRVWCACAGIVESINKSQFACFSLLAGFSRVLARRKTRATRTSLRRDLASPSVRPELISRTATGLSSIVSHIELSVHRGARPHGPSPASSVQRPAGRPARRRAVVALTVVSTHLRLVLDRCLWCPPA